MAKGLMYLNKGDNMQEQMGNGNREMRIPRGEKKQKNTRDKEYCNRNEECLRWTY